MTWQEDIRRLDDELSEGVVSSEEYRRRRDEILASASGAGPATTSSPFMRKVEPTSAAPPEEPEEPAERTVASNMDSVEVTKAIKPAKPAQPPAVEPAERTEVVELAEPDEKPEKPEPVAAQKKDELEATQTVKPPAERQKNDETTETRIPAALAEFTPTSRAKHDPAADATQVINPDITAPHPTATWSSRLPEPTTRPDPGVLPARPAGPPAFPPPGPAVPIQGRDVFASSAKSSSKKPLLIGLVVLLVLALAGAGVWWFVLRDKPADQAQTQPQSPPPSTSSTAAPPPTSQAPPAARATLTGLTLAGQADPRSGDLTVAKARDSQLIVAPEATLLEQAGFAELSYKGANIDKYSLTVFAFHTQDGESAKRMLESLKSTSKQIGLTDADRGQLPQSVSVMKLANAQAALHRAFYVSGSSVIMVGTLQVPAGAPADLDTQAAQLVRAATETAPPS
ncbi:hypothetical protein EV193_10530 [Herbihabitans rhizosphaerae]|uniref:Uncharacterized protein n=1 Tax=Herbihabitans rhizosphaerae TaxID=1872711 RepID=A0A4Q7KLS0_9PSEU|nr:hypothetical protein [Herbihabitans rhizosphaerae]RZS37475.1 hypothetical protein EV193_10530 [Herbihabitans rhizosphaerae]